MRYGPSLLEVVHEDELSIGVDVKGDDAFWRCAVRGEDGE